MRRQKEYGERIRPGMRFVERRSENPDAVSRYRSALGDDQPIDEDAFAAAARFDRKIEVVLLIRFSGVVYFAQKAARVAHRQPQGGVAVVDGPDSRL